jgi:DHA1 family putative efflux transporter-like MFS transporter
VGGSSILAICWIGAAAVAFAASVAAVSFSLARSSSKSVVRDK